MIHVETDGKGDRDPSRRRIVTAAMATTLAMGALGFIVGRATGGDETRSVVGAPGPTIDPPPASSTTGVPTTVTLEEPAPTEQTAAVTTSVPGTDGPAAEETVAIATGNDSSDDAVAATAATYPYPYPMPMGDGFGDPGSYGGPPWTLIVERTTDAGITLRAHLQEFGAQMMPPPFQWADGWQPAGWCVPTGTVRVGVTNATSIGVVGGMWFAEPFAGASGSPFDSGFVEGTPITGAVIQVSPDVASITYTESGGASDVAVPTAGLVVLAVPSAGEAPATIAISRTDGSVETLTSNQFGEHLGSAEFRRGCDPPPPALPPAGEQPSDPAAAEAAFRQSWDVARNFDEERTDRLDYVDDPTGIAEAWDELLAGQYGENALSANSIIRELTFTSPTEVWFRYDIETTLTTFFDRYGVARLDADGVWRITRATLCQDLTLAPGVSCNPPVDRVLPPSAVDDPRFNPAMQPGGPMPSGPPPGAPFPAGPATTMVAD